MSPSHLVADAVVSHALAASLSVLFLVGAVAKLRDLALLRTNLENYQLLPERAVPAAAIVLGLWELACGVAVLLAPGAALTQLAAGALLALVTGAVAINLMRGRTHIDCGCGGLSGHGDQPLSGMLVARNALLLLALLGAAAGSGAEERDLQWVDYLSVAGATLGLLGLYVAAGQLLVNHPRLQAIKRS